MKRSALLLTSVLLAAPGIARGESETHTADVAHAADDHAGHHYANHVAVFGAGLSSNLEHSTSSYTLGVDYVRRFGAFGVGALAESVFAHHRETIYAGLASVHPWQGLKLFAGAGQIRADHHAYFLKRFGVGYDIHHGRFSVSPGIALDLFHGEEVLVYGVSVGLGF